MLNISGQWTIVVNEETTKTEARLVVEAGFLDIECNRTDTEDDKHRLSVYIKYHGYAFDDAAEFKITAYYDVFGSTIMRHWKQVDSATSGFTATFATDEPDDGLYLEALPLDLNELQ